MEVIKSLVSPVEAVYGSATPTYRFVISTDDVDRDGDIVDQKGWDFNEFSSNPICLLGHDHQKPVGKWANITTRQKSSGRGYETVADLVLAPPVSDTLKYANALVEAGVLNSCSVGFAVKAYEKRKDSSGKPLTKGHLIKSAVLREVSLVSVPANAAAIRIAKSHSISQEVIKNFLVANEVADSSIDIDDDTPLPNTLALDKAQKLLSGHKTSKTKHDSAFKKRVNIKDSELLAAYEKAQRILNKKI